MLRRNHNNTGALYTQAAPRPERFLMLRWCPPFFSDLPLNRHISNSPIPFYRQFPSRCREEEQYRKGERPFPPSLLLTIWNCLQIQEERGRRGEAMDFVVVVSASAARPSVSPTSLWHRPFPRERGCCWRIEAFSLLSSLRARESEALCGKGGGRHKRRRRRRRLWRRRWGTTWHGCT